MRFADPRRANGAPDGGNPPSTACSSPSRRLLVSPNFLFRIERDPDPRNPALVHKVSPFELASRLSYFLWSSMPDEELLSAAESGRLNDARVLAAQVDRMLADSRASEFAANFAGQWLETRNLDVVKPDPDVFKAMDARAARRHESGDDDVLRSRAAREPADHGLPERLVHLPQRTARRSLRHRRRVRSGAPPRRADDRPSRRRAEPGRRAHRVELSDTDVRSHPREVRAAEHPRHSAGAAARRCAGAQRISRRRHTLDARAVDRPSQQSDLRGLPSQHGSARLRARELRCDRAVA